jgi:hypothetical protein
MARPASLRMFVAACATVAVALLAPACSDGGDTAETTTTPAPPPETTTPPTTEQPGEQLFVFTLAPGECFDQRVIVDEDEGEIPADFLVDCSLPHQNEVFVSVEYPAAVGDPYPDENAWNQFLAEQCYALVEVYVGTPYELSELEVSHRKPTPESWAAEPDRQVTCWLHNRDGSKLAESVMGANR